jgi:hypothetical protein
MRHSILLFTTLFIAFSLSAQIIDTEEKLGIEMLKAFQKKDYTKYRTLLLTTEVYIDMIPYMRKQMKMDNPEPFLQFGIDFYKSGKLDTLNQLLFKEIISKGTSLGIEDWNEISFDKFELQKVNQKIEGPQSFNGDLYFLYNKKKYRIFLISGTKMKDRAYLIQTRGIIKVSD